MNTAPQPPSPAPGIADDRAGAESRSAVTPTSPLFRERALQAYRGHEAPGRLLRSVSPRGWALHLVLTSLFAVAVGAAVLGKVELSTRGRGVLRADGGVQALVAQAPGVVRVVHARSGDRVLAGAPILEVDSAALQSQLLEADERVRLVGSALTAMETRQRALFGQRTHLLDERAELLQRRLEMQRDTVARLGRRAEQVQQGADQGVVTARDADVAREEAAAAERQGLGIEEELNEVRTTLATLRSQREAEVYASRQEEQSARARRDALALLLAQNRVTVTQDGWLEAILVRPGDVVEAGTPLGKLVPDREARQIVAFVPERDRAFLDVGALARVEVDRLPAGEFGSLTGKVTRVSADLASTAEMADAFGPQAGPPEAAYRVELELVDDAQAARLARWLRAGALVEVRFALRRRSVITLVLEPLRRFLE